MRCRKLLAASFATVAAVSLLIVGCGGGSSPTAAVPAQNGLVAYSRCMRSHGVPTFPDPTSSEGIPKDQIPVSNPRLPAASNDCEHLMPAGGLGSEARAQSTPTRFAAALAFARCMHDRGFPNFPDPTAQGQLTPHMVTAAGIDLHQPALLKAGLACAPVTRGLITRAAVQRAVNGG